jgi:hypothetical protein
MGVPDAAQELLLDAVSGWPHLVTLHIEIRPASGSIEIYPSKRSPPILCQGPESQITVACKSGRIFVRKCSGATQFKINIVETKAAEPE